MRFEFIAKHRGIWPVSWICEALGVSRSGFHAWLIRAPSKRARCDEEFGARVRASFISSYRTYGARRVWHDLLAEGLSCGLHRIERLMRVHGLRARPRRRGLPKDDGLRSVIADNILDRQFNAEAPNQRWIADFTYIRTAEGWLYVAVVIDLFSRRVVGWSRQMRFDMICDANGIEHRLTKPNHPWTNGQVERMNRTIKEATVKRFHYESHDQLRTHLADFMAAYNFARRLKTLSGLTPYEYIAKIWTSDPDRFIVDPIHQMPGLNT